MTADQLKELLRTVPNVEAPTVDVHGDPPHLFATVTSGSFANMDEAERQKIVWGYLRAQRPAEAIEVEFIFTNAPGEQA